VLTVLTQTPPFGAHRRFRTNRDALEARAQFDGPNVGCVLENGFLGAARRAEVVDGEILVTLANEAALRRALEDAGIDFIEEDGGGEGVRREGPKKGGV
jgi:hypothetical protein